MSIISGTRDRGGIAEEIREPRQWKFDGDTTRRVPVIDPNLRRVIRHVGYRKCLCCPKFFWSDDVVRVRICDYCKAYKSD